MPRLLFIGDLMGRPGRNLLTHHARALKERLRADFLVANAENAAGGAGLTTVIANELVAAGVDAITLGDHCWDQRGFPDEISSLEKVCRPANLPPNCPGRDHLILEREGIRLAVFTVLGQTFLRMKSDCPFRTAERLLDRIGGGAVLCEVHAEATSEKAALGWFLDGRATAVLGTHTHIPTADPCIHPRGTAYQTDVGMTGPQRSVIGFERQPTIARYLDGIRRKADVANEDNRIRGACVDFHPEGYATAIAPLDWTEAALEALPHPLPLDSAQPEPGEGTGEASPPDAPAP